MPFSVSLIGFRHGHIQDLIQRIQTRDDLQLVAACEESATERADLSALLPDTPVYSSYSQMLDEVQSDIVAVGDVYGLRGQRVISALENSSHVVSDKPICTRLEELARIEKLSAEKNLCIGCQFDVRDHANFRALHQIVRGGEIGEVCAVSFGGQHPLNYGSRASWYFEQGAHGGTLNDIAIHAFDFVPWITGSPIATIQSARAWNAHFSEVPHFQNAAQIMLSLESGAGVLGDVSYLMPDSFGYALPHYWRTTIWGTRGMAETNYNADGAQLYQNGQSEPQTVKVEGNAGGYLEAFIREIRGESKGDWPTTESNLRTQRVALQAQEAAETGQANFDL